MSTRADVAHEAQEHLKAIDECVAKLSVWSDAAQAQPPATNRTSAAIADLKLALTYLEDGAEKTCASKIRAAIKRLQRQA